MALIDDDVRRFAKHGNAFGFIRLCLAALVVVAHTPELIDGNRDRELLTGWFHTITFGELAVDGFFIVSGYLICGSWQKNPNALFFLVKRIARLYPAFAAMSVICIVMAAPAGGAPSAEIWTSLAGAAGQILTLQRPDVLRRLPVYHTCVSP